ncbi:MAG: hypothetical protein H7308_09455 [Chthonomonadaceae bacterium]|nr:hypothetical protein [Chthonomonadaceae bacterium]
MKQNRMSRFMFILGCVIASVLYWNQVVNKWGGNYTVGTEKVEPLLTKSIAPVQNPTQPTSKPILNEQVDYIHFVYGGFDPTYWHLGTITEPEMIAGVVEVLNHPIPISRPTGNQFFTGTVSSELIVHFKPVRGVTPEPVGGQLHRDLFYNYGVPMWEMMQRLGKFRAERARQLFTKRAGEIVKIEWINPTKPPFKESTEDKRNIASIVKQLKNVDERCFAYTDSVGVCPLQLFSGTERLH